jgi:hypothetical protein
LLELQQSSKALAYAYSVRLGSRPSAWGRSTGSTASVPHLPAFAEGFDKLVAEPVFSNCGVCEGMPSLRPPAFGGFARKALGFGIPPRHTPALQREINGPSAVR